MVCIVIGTGYIGTEMCEETVSAATPAIPIRIGAQQGLAVGASLGELHWEEASCPVNGEAELWDASGNGSSSPADTTCQRRNTK
jgi:hypothetical protein